MQPKKFHIGNRIQSNDGEDNVLEFYFMDTIQNEVNWFTGEEDSMLGQIIDKVNETKPTIIRQCIDSWGGSAPVGLGIYNYFKDKKAHKAKRVESKILNNCASIASVMCCAGENGYITMPRNGIMVIHKASGQASGTADELRTAADVIDVYTENVLDVYVQNNRKGKTRDEIFDLIKDGDYWMTGTQAKEMGFVDDIYNDESVTITNSINLAEQNYGKVPAHIKNLVPQTDINILNNAIMEVKNMMEEFKLSIKNSAVPVEVQNNIFAVLEKPLEGILNSINSSIEAEKTLVTDSVTNKVTEIRNEFEGLMNGLKESITALTTKQTEQEEKITSQEEINTAQKNTIDEQSKTIKALKANVRTLMGKPSNSIGDDKEEGETGVGGKNVKTFAGRMKFSSGGTD